MCYVGVAGDISSIKELYLIWLGLGVNGFEPFQPLSDLGWCLDFGKRLISAPDSSLRFSVADHCLIL